MQGDSSYTELENLAPIQDLANRDRTDKVPIQLTEQEVSLTLLQCQTWVEIVEQVQKDSKKLSEALGHMDKLQGYKIASLLIDCLCQEPQLLSELAWLPAKMLGWVMKHLTFSVERIGGTIHDARVEIVENLSFVAVDYLGTSKERWIFSTVSGANIPVFGTESICGIATRPSL